MKSIFIKNSILSNSIAHIGVGLMLVGVVISSNFSDHKELVLNYGDSITIADRKINFVGIKNVKAVNYFSKTGVFESFNQDNYEITFSFNVDIFCISFHSRGIFKRTGTWCYRAYGY